MARNFTVPVAAVVFLALAVAMTWPLAPNFTRAVADPGDPFINVWALDWDWFATLHQPLHLFDANAFYPAKLTLAYSDHLYGIALLLFPLRALGVDALTAHNAGMLLAFAFSGFAAFLLGRMLTGSAVAGIAAGVFYAFVPFRFTHLGHLHFVFAGWLPMLVAGLLHYARRPSWGRAALFGAAFLMNGLSNVHWLIFGSIAAALSLPIAVPRPRDWTRIAAATAVAAALLAPFVAPYSIVARMYGVRESAAEMRSYSAAPRDWLNPGVANRLYRRFADTNVDAERWLFPGALSIVLAASWGVAVVGGWIRTPKRRPASRRDAGAPIALLMIVLGFVGSLGVIPLFGAIRAPARWANIAYLGLAMLVACAVAEVARRWRWAGVALAVLFVFELRAAPIRWYVAVRDVPAVDRWLASQPVRIIEVPFGTAEQEYRPMRWSTAHHRPMANGILRVIPPEYLRLARMWQAPEIGYGFVDELRRIGIDLIVVDGENVFDRERRWLRAEVARGRLAFVRKFDRGRWGDWVFSTRGGPSSSPQLEAFLRGEYTYNDIAFGMLDSPPPGPIGPPGWFTGYALSPYGVREVNLLFNNGAIRIPTILRPDPSVAKAFPWYPVPAPRFMRAFPHRPHGVRRETDVQVEIVDGKGEKTLLEDRWIEWK